MSCTPGDRVGQLGAVDAPVVISAGVSVVVGGGGADDDGVARTASVVGGGVVVIGDAAVDDGAAAPASPPYTLESLYPSLHAANVSTATPASTRCRAFTRAVSRSSV